MKNDSFYNGTFNYGLCMDIPGPNVVEYTYVTTGPEEPIDRLEATWDEVADTVRISLTTAHKDTFEVTRHTEGKVVVEDVPGIITQMVNALLFAAGYSNMEHYKFYQWDADAAKYHMASRNLHVTPDSL